MKKTLLISLYCFSAFIINTQTFTNTIGGPIPDIGPKVYFPINFAGLTFTTIDSAFGLETVCFTIHHMYDSDLQISLLAKIAPALSCAV